MYQATVRIVFSPSDFPSFNKEEMIQYIHLKGSIKALEDIFDLASIIPLSCSLKDSQLDKKIDTIISKNIGVEIFFEISIS